MILWFFCVCFHELNIVLTVLLVGEEVVGDRVVGEGVDVRGQTVKSVSKKRERRSCWINPNIKSDTMNILTTKAKH